MKPVVSSVVIYKLAEYDAEQINRRRADFAAFNREHGNAPAPLGHFPGRSGHIGHCGNTVSVGDEYPAVVVRMFGSTTVNLHVLLDGNDTYWATSRMQGDEPCQWSWPQTPEREPGDRPAH